MKTRVMNEKTKNDLFEAWAYCDWQDKSTEFMLEYMQCCSDVDLDLDDVLEFIEKESNNRDRWYQNNPNWYLKYKN